MLFYQLRFILPFCLLLLLYTRLGLSYYDHLLKNVAAGNAYVHFIDYDYFWPIAYFADVKHVNQDGADQLTGVVFCQIAAVGIFAPGAQALPACRNGAATASETPGRN